MCRVTGQIDAGAAEGRSKAGDAQALETVVDEKSGVGEGGRDWARSF